MILKCKMCGGTLDVADNNNIAICQYCGTKQTLPKLDTEKRFTLYERAGHFRRNNEFDKAMEIYEQILAEDQTDAEAYWSIVLCRYGIEYVEDPSTKKRIPTINRMQYTSVFDDEDYKSAIENALAEQKNIYEAEAKQINEIQKGILAISQKEEPFDIFICYKETDVNGRRTHDSVLANELYHGLVKEGYKVFFAKITLEDKLGIAYEPYIFAALNSAKVMVVLGTRPEHFNAVWVKNEWSRYLALVKNSDGEKVLIPAYRDMDAYDLPEEFAHLQALDMGKLGFMQDLIRGIKKLVRSNASKTAPKETIVVNSGNTNVAPLLKRAFMFLEDGEFERADSFCEQVLNSDPENAQAYLVKLMIALRLRKQDQLFEQTTSYENNGYFQKALRFADDSFKATLLSYIEHIEETRKKGIYDCAKSIMDSAKTEGEYKQAASQFETIGDYRDSATLARKCYEKAEVARKDGILSVAKSKMTGTVISNYESAIKLFESISGWKDADEQIEICKKRIEELKAERERKAEIARIEAEKRAKRNKKVAAITIPIICAVIAFVIVLNTVIIPNGKYNDAVALMNEGKIVAAYEALIALDGYKDSAEKASSIYNKYKLEKLKVAEVGDYVFFGAYEQDNNISNGKEDIEWIVLDKEDDKVLVVSKYALDCQQYNTSYTDVT